MKALPIDAPDVGPTFSEKVMLRLSAGRRIDGLWVGTFFQTNAETVLRRVEEALRLIKEYDRRRYDRIVSDLERVWVRLLPGDIAQFSYSLRACVLDERFVLADTTLPELIAGAIVHEATHARLWRCGIGYEEGLRQRVEEVCLRRELAFASKLPDGRRLRELAEQALATPPAAWTSGAFQERELKGSIEVLHRLGVPDRLVRILLAIRAWRASRTAATTK